MWSHDSLLRLAQMRRAELLEQAERERIARQVTGNPSRSARLGDRVLGWLGQRLIAIGQRLQSNHRAVMTSAVLHSTRRSR